MHPSSLKKTIDRFTEDFKGYAQRDAHELLRFFIQQMNDELKQEVQHQTLMEEPGQGFDYESEAILFIQRQII